MPEETKTDTGASTETITGTDAKTIVETKLTKWQDTISPDLKEKLFMAGRFEKDDSPSNLAKSYLELERKNSQIDLLVKIPDDKSTPEEKESFYKKLGKLESADKYAIKYEEGVVKDPVLDKEIQQAAFTANLSQKQLDVLAAAVNKVAIQRDAEITKLNNERWTNLKVKWGDNRTKENIELAKRCFDKFAPEELKKLMTREDVEQDPILVTMYADIWRTTLDDTFVKSETLPKGEEYKPYFINSPEQYRNGDDDESKKARAWFEKNKGYKY